MSDVKTETRTNPAQTPRATPNHGEVATFSRARIAYHPAILERFGVDAAGWRALIDAIWPAAKTADAVVLALSYCKARKLDPFKRPVHIVPVWSKELKRMTEGIWPAIAELRTTAFRTGLYAGRDKPEYGETIEDDLGGTKVRYPEFCEITVYRLGKSGERMPYPGPRVYWLETYATAGRDTMAPNEMWKRRPFGQIEKCAEAAALRAAFPEEIGNEYAAEEMEGQVIDTAGNIESEATTAEKAGSKLDRFEQRHRTPVTDIEPEPETSADGADAFEIVDHVGEVWEIEDLDEALGFFETAFEKAIRARGVDGLLGLWESNALFMTQLEERGHGEISKRLGMMYAEHREACEARKTEAEKIAAASATKAINPGGEETDPLADAPLPDVRQGTLLDATAGSPAPTAKVRASSSVGPGPSAMTPVSPSERVVDATRAGTDAVPRGTAETDPRPRSALWQETSYTLDLPMMDNNKRLNGAVLRDQLLYFIEDAESEAELDKFVLHNAVALVRLSDDSKSYRQTVDATIAACRQRLHAGGK